MVVDIDLRLDIAVFLPGVASFLVAEILRVAGVENFLVVDSLLLAGASYLLEAVAQFLPWAADKLRLPGPVPLPL